MFFVSIVSIVKNSFEAVAGGRVGADKKVTNLHKSIKIDDVMFVPALVYCY